MSTPTAQDNVHSHSVTLNNADQLDLSQYKGKVLLLVNTASKCGFTPQYEGLEALYQSHKDKGLEIIGFPCDQFGHQEPGNDDEIAQFCSLKFNVSFPMSTKVEVNGDNTTPLYQTLKTQAPGLLGSTRIKWNFTKFLVSKDGQVVKRYAPTTKPQDIVNDIEAELAKTV
ncbi:glutathione peroxidase [Glaciecola sp. XM2]|jgi:glutathione peroxidase|uniref:glutathione peroxidase n=1 Tax=Glaciecola sp. XM2 TaxID=1914931 RepID=UPI001BDF5B5F|nr:glutathione peroxidase [Glaciecola sp. XM2]MBT1451973.1 glutathione peroxidase [Glaciecola sp. XM2]